MNFGTVGTGWITASFIEAAEISGKMTLKAVHSRSLEKAKAFAATHHAPHAYNDVEQLAQNEDIDVVYIASPNSAHYDQAIMFLRHKKHVICEKPIFSNTKELTHAYKVAEENGVYLFEAVRNIQGPNFKVLKAELTKIGQVRGATFNYLKYSSRYDLFLKGEEPNVFSTTFSGGALVDLGVYPLYLAVAIFGEPKSLAYHPVILRNGVDGSGTLILEYPEATVTLTFSKISQSYLASEIQGEKGTILIDKPAPMSKLEFIDHRTEERVSFGTNQHDQDMIYEIETFVDIIESNNYQAYQELRKLSEIVLSITEAARKQNGIVFGEEK